MSTDAICHIVANCHYRQISIQLALVEAMVQEQQLVKDSLRIISSRVPNGWDVTANDASLSVKAPDGRSTTLAIATTWPGQDRARPGNTLFIAPYLSASQRQRLTTQGINYADLTGNTRIVIAKPGLFIETTGATKNPAPAVAERTLKGAKAARVVRALIELPPPFRLRDLAARSGTDVGYTSRVLRQVELDGLLRRERRAAVVEVQWESLLRRWTDDYGVTASNAVTYALAPRGITALLELLRSTSSLRYALTGSAAAALRAPLAPTTLATLYVDDRELALSTLELKKVSAGGNVALLTPRDSLPFEGTTTNGGIVVAAPAQIAADLLTGPGRSTEEAEAFIEWMAANEDVWRH